MDAVIACTSLHHVPDLDLALDLIAATGAGTVVVIECAHERFDERTAQWCFAHLAEGEQEPGWLHAHREQFAESGLAFAAAIGTTVATVAVAAAISRLRPIRDAII